MVYARGVKSPGATRGGRNCLSCDNALWRDAHNFSSLSPDAEHFARAGEDSCTLLRGAERKANRKYAVKSQGAWSNRRRNAPSLDKHKIPEQASMCDLSLTMVVPNDEPPGEKNQSTVNGRRSHLTP
jgi:hypothetical protein